MIIETKFGLVELVIVVDFGHALVALRFYAAMIGVKNAELLM